MRSIDKNTQNIGNGESGETVERFTKKRRFGMRCLRLFVASVLLATFFATLTSCAEEDSGFGAGDSDFFSQLLLVQLTFVDESGVPTPSPQTSTINFLMQTERITTYDDGRWETSEISDDAIRFEVVMFQSVSVGSAVIPNVPYGEYYVYVANDGVRINREMNTTLLVRKNASNIGDLEMLISRQ